MTKQEIGTILKNARESIGLTQKQVAELLKRNQQTVGHWETGYAQPDANTLFELCDIYQISIDDAFGKHKSESLTSIPSLKATEIATIFDTLSPSGQELVQSVVDFASKYHSK